jgi:hypothetical protein
MFERYVELEISVEPRRGTTYPLSVRGPGGDARGTLRLPISDPTYQQLAARLATLDTDEDSLTQIGQMLFAALFRSNAEIRSVYTRAQGTLKPDEGLRLKFDIGENEIEVSALPWEFLYDPDQIGPMATLDTPIVRYLPQSSVLPRMAAQLPLKVLLTGAATEPKPDVNGALAEVRAALEPLGNAVAVTIEPHLTRQKFQRLLRESYHIWHFIGHGAPATDSRSGVLLFEDAQGDAERVSARDLGILLNRNSIRLIVLNACDSAKLAIDPFRSVAPALLKAQIPGVIAMQLRVKQDAALAFSGEFYRALAEGFPLDACVTEGRKAIIGVAGLRNADWGIPVVYTRAEDGGRLFDKPATPASMPSTAPSSGVNIAIGDKNNISGSSINVSNVGNNTTSSAPISSAGSKDDETTQQIAYLQDLIYQKKRRLQQLKLQAARYGISVPPEIATEIEDLEGYKDYRGNLLRPGEIAKLESDLRALGG